MSVKIPEEIKNPDVIINQSFQWDKFPLESDRFYILITSPIGKLDRAEIVLNKFLKIFPEDQKRVKTLDELNALQTFKRVPENFWSGTAGATEACRGQGMFTPEGSALFTNLLGSTEKTLILDLPKTPEWKTTKKVLEILEYSTNYSHVIAIGENVKGSLLDNFDMIVFINPSDANEYLEKRVRIGINSSSIGDIPLLIDLTKEKTVLSFMR